MDEALINRFDYDEVFGTVLNRFCVQAALGYPLTVYGKGGQTRGFLDIRDTVRCVELACLNPAAPGEFRVFNQFTEQFSVLDLAHMVKTVGAIRWASRSKSITLQTRASKPKRTTTTRSIRSSIDLGLEPHCPHDSLLDSLMNIAVRYRDRIDPDFFTPAGQLAQRPQPAQHHQGRQTAGISQGVRLTLRAY